MVKWRVGQAHICEKVSLDRLFVGFITVVAADGCGRCYSGGEAQSALVCWGVHGGAGGQEWEEGEQSGAERPEELGADCVTARGACVMWGAVESRNAARRSGG